MTFQLIHRTATTAVLGSAATLVIVLAGCASPPAPSAQMAVSEAAVAHANTEPTRAGAPAQLEQATMKLSQARSALAAKDMPEARRLAEEAEVDAQVAEAHAQSIRNVKAAADSEDSARALREEINRKTTQ